MKYATKSQIQLWIWTIVITDILSMSFIAVIVLLRPGESLISQSVYQREPFKR